MRHIDMILIRIGALYLMVGLLSDLILSGTRFDILACSHGHLYLIGFCAHIVFGLVYQHMPLLKLTRLARIHASLFIAGAPLLIIGFSMPMENNLNNALMFGGLLVFLGALAFTMNVFSPQPDKPVS